MQGLVISACTNSSVAAISSSWLVSILIIIDHVILTGCRESYLILLTMIAIMTM